MEKEKTAKLDGCPKRGGIEIKMWTEDGWRVEMKTMATADQVMAAEQKITELLEECCPF